jgi:pimeloyl-ACP methyl ester carboxylesterase
VVTADASPEHRTLRLPDGRRLTYLDLGDPFGSPVVHSHGSPSSARETAFFDLGDAARRAGVRLLALDRPGIGGSSPRPGRSLLDWGDDVAAAADALGVDRYGLLGYSAGAASALACRHRTPSRILATAIVSGIGPPDVAGLADGRAPDVARIFRLAATRPRLTSAALRFMRFGTRTPDRMIAATARSMPPADQAVAARPAAAAPFAAFFADALRQGTSGARDDLRLVALPWGFAPEPASSALLVWHGTADTNVPVAAAHWLRGLVPEAEVTFVEDAGHVSLLDERADEVLGRLGAAARAA